MRKCSFPFENIEIDLNGDVFTCCSNWINNYSLGNVYENTLEEIWNSEKAQKLRENILNNDYSICSKDYCQYINGDFPKPHVSENDMKIFMEKMPTIVKLSYDKECNIACRICRDDVMKNTDEELKKLDEHFEKRILSGLKDAKIVTINAHGDPFGSRHCRKVIKKIMETFPDIKFDFHTNGTLCDKNLLKRLHVENKIEVMRISVSAATAETYGKIVKNGEKLFDKLKSNLKMLGELRKEQNFEFYIHFIVTSRNYTEMVDFIELAEECNAVPCFWEFTFDCVWYAKTLDKTWEITDKNHPEYEKLKTILKDKKFDKYKIYMSPLLLKIREEA